MRGDATTRVSISAAAFPDPPISILSKASLISCTSPKAFIVSASRSATHNVDGENDENISILGIIDNDSAGSPLLIEDICNGIRISKNRLERIVTNELQPLYE
eukprot:CAMPEP_0170121350 /NCGR_PEP_ID=MMETSP0020_2-20130122/15821_1 /TAXON_ID=98059 /ORGANISM="Dinobryon sp., Strain UTEXLB2267" /LENGTH=102 /DNA_ID=CAMNT_0010351659 /DNA_START=1 /DNA_END=309 /DNA_ORIENTATION=+